ncbi:hypothetical protein TKK_0005175 [Trichogramma kaykai]
MSRLERLQRLARNNGDFQTMEEGLTVFGNIRALLKEWLDAPKLEEIFRPEQIDRLLVNALKLYHILWDRSEERRLVYNPCEPGVAYFIWYVIRSGYVGEPELDADGRPVTRRGTALHEALRCDRRFFRCLIINETVPGLFDIYPRFEANYVDEDGLTHFHAACRLGRVNMVERFLDAGADPNCRASSGSGLTALHFALQTDILGDRRSVLNLLLKRGADPNLADARGRSPLHVICSEFGYDWFLTKMVDGLCKKEYKPLRVNARDDNDDTPLGLALRCGYKQVAYLLRKYDDGSTPTDIAPEETISRKMARLSVD